MTANSVRRARSRTALDTPRRVAYAVLLAVERDDAYLNLALSRRIAEAALPARDAAFATELAAGTTRMRGSYDAVLEACVTEGSASLQLAVRTALRLGAHQLLSMRVAAHAAVATTVELVRAEVGERPVRLVNAVLRAVAARPFDEWMTSVAPPREQDLAGSLSVHHSHPRWIVDTFLDVLPSDEAEAALAADNVPAPVTLAVRPGLETVEQLGQYGARSGRWSPYAAVLSSGDPGELPAVRVGRAGVQDEGSQLAALALSRASASGSDQLWLDLCAGPGGKAALLAGIAAGNGATLIAVDRHPHRARLVRQALRAYPTRPPVVVADSTRSAWRGQTFDRVLVDAPCTGLGALRRRPDARWRRQPTDLYTLVPLQRSLLEAALAAVRPGGVVAYATCSPHPAETRSVVDYAVQHRGDIIEEDARPLLDVPDVGPGPSVQLWPHRHDTDAMFIAILRRGAGRAGEG